MTDTELKVREFMLYRRQIIWDPADPSRTLQMPFEELGYTSLEVVEIIMDCEQEWRIEILDDEILPNVTPAALSVLVDGKRELRR